MKFKMLDSELLRKLFSSVQILGEEAELKIEADGIGIRSMDPSRVAMVDTYWPKAAFEEYAKPKANEKVRLNIAELMKLLKRASREEATELELDDKTGRVHVRITGKYNKKFTLPTLESSDEELPVPKITFNAWFKFTSTGLSTAIEDTQLVSDHVQFIAEDDKLTLNAQGDLMTATIELTKSSADFLDVKIKEKSKAAYNLQYLEAMIKQAAALTEITTLEFSNDMPVKMNSEKNSIVLTYYLAPRIEAE
jgi:proliferating cell nuclear antigen